jgi:predicted kinase
MGFLMQNELVLVRGLPGSGKTTFVQKNFPEYTQFEADLYRYDGRGLYIFEPELNYLCHKLCIASTKCALRRREDVAVANTFVTRKEMKPYFELAEEYNVPIKVFTCTGEFKSIHNVPEWVVERMKERWED